MPKSKGFTLIELLVVIAIIGILSTIAMVSFRSSQIRGRDVQRKSNLKEISTALETFYSDYGLYPASSNGAIKACEYNPDGPETSVSCVWGSDEEFTDGKTVYMRKLPSDPSGFDYYYRVVNQQSYQLYAHLENTEDQNCISGDCITDNAPKSNPVPDCGNDEICNFSVTSSNVTPQDEINDL